MKKEVAPQNSSKHPKLSTTKQHERMRDPIDEEKYILYLSHAVVGILASLHIDEGCPPHQEDQRDPAMLQVQNAPPQKGDREKPKKNTNLSYFSPEDTLLGHNIEYMYHTITLTFL